MAKTKKSTKSDDDEMKRGPGRPKMKLNPRHELFAIEIANGLTAADAYRIVYGQGNRTDAVLYKDASELRRKVDVRVQEILEARAQTSEEDRKECNKILMDIARANVKSTMYADPKSGKMKMRSPQQLSDSTANAIYEMTNNNGKVTYRFHGKTEAIRVLAQINGWNAPSKSEIEVNGVDGVKYIDFGDFPDSLKD